jgi:hypothetical protein
MATAVRRRIFIAGVSVVIISCGLVLAVWLDAFTPKAPAGWSKVHAGMTRDEVLRLAGTPTFSGWPEKIAETWQRDGFPAHRRLFIVYQGEQVISVCDGTWLRGYGWMHPRTESR